jgi:radical SAM protein with 4Fe4S-binding SPASM domain
MRVDGRRYRDEWLPNFYPRREVAGNCVRVSRTGRLAVLTRDEDRQLEEISMDEALFERLERSGHLVTERNSDEVLRAHRTWFSGTYAGPRLHIVVTTKRCNLSCTYCHMFPESARADPTRFDLQPDTAEAIVRFILSSPNPRATIEFQGGEPFLNFAAIQHVVETAQALNRDVGKVLHFTVVSNLMVAKDSQLEYCAANRIGVSYSLNGPAFIHDRFRITPAGHGSFNQVMRRIRQIQERFPGLLSASPLCVVSADNTADLIPTIDFFHDAGFDGVAILKLRRLGKARVDDLPFDVRDFLDHYLDALDYIVEKNVTENWHFSERMVRVVLTKILGEADVGYVDWRNPCGDVSGALTYDHDGEILPSDEARSLRDEFGLGNVRTTSYEQLMRSPRTFRTMNLSLRDRDPVCRECGYNPYCGVAPVLDFARTGDATPRPHESEECLFTLAVLDWAIARLLDDPLPLIQMLPTGDRWIADQLGLGDTSRDSAPMV